jgi:hypothetical protein
MSVPPSTADLEPFTQDTWQQHELNGGGGDIGVFDGHVQVGCCDVRLPNTADLKSATYAHHDMIYRAWQQHEVLSTHSLSQCLPTLHDVPNSC